MAILKNTNDLLTQAGATLQNNTTQQISPTDVREAVENTAFSSYNKLTDSAIVGLKAYSPTALYETGQGCTYLGAFYIANKPTGNGIFNVADWNASSSSLQGAYSSSTEPEIVTTTARGAVTIKRGSAADTDAILQGQNGAGSNTFSVTGAGLVQGRNMTTDGTKLDGIEALADVTDAANVDAAGATMNADTSLAGNGYFLNDGTFAANSATKVPSQASVKTYVDTALSGASSIYTSNGTFSGPRTAKLSGNTINEFLTFQTLAGNNIAKFYGDNSIDFGNSTAGRFRFYTNAAENDNVIVYSGNTPYAYFQSANRVFLMYGTNANNYIQLDATGGGIRSQGTAAGISLYNTTNQLAGTFSFAGGGGWFKLLDAGVSKVEFYAPANQYYMAGGCSFGYVNSGSPAAIMDVRGNSIFRGGGSTSSTFTAIFRNSSIVDLLTIRDDGQVSFKNFTLGLYGATPVAQHSTTGTITGITHNGGSAFGATDTLTGGVGTTAYTISDLVKALKNVGLLAQ